MAFFDLSKIREGVESGAKMAQEGLAAGIKSAQEGLSNFKVDDMVEGARGAVATGTSAIGGIIDGIVPKDSKEDEPPSSCREFVAILWYLVHVDGAFSVEEREALDRIAGDIDSNYSAYASELEEECASTYKVSVAEFGLQAAAKVEAQKIIESMEISPRDAKLMCWNLLALAGSDGIDESELDFIRFVSAKAGVSQSVFEELRNYNDAIVEIGTTCDQLKASDRGYSEIEPLVSEFEKREQVILEAVQALVSDR